MKDLIDRKHIEIALNDIFISRLGLDFNKIKQNLFDCYNKNLLGKEFQLAPRDLLYIFFDVEKKFAIEIPEKSILDGFNTFNHIITCIIDTKSVD